MGDTVVSDPQRLTEKYFKGHTCRAEIVAGIPKSTGCTVTIASMNGQSPMLMKVSFDSLVFRKNGISEYLTLSVSRPL
jgi:hypothetical protein